MSHIYSIVMIKNRIKEICKKKGLQLSDIAKGLNMSPPNLSYTIKKKEIDNLTLQRIADILNVPISDLLSEEPLPDYNKADLKLYNRSYSPYTLQIGKICKIKGITLQELASRMGITYQSLHNLTKSPNLQSLERISYFLNVPLYCLFSIEEEEIKIPVRYIDKETDKITSVEINIKVGFQ